MFFAIGLTGINAVTSNTTLDGRVFTVPVDATLGDITISLPEAEFSKGRVFNVKKIDSSSNAVIIDGFAGETIDDVTTKSLTAQYDALSVQCDGINWYAVWYYSAAAASSTTPDWFDVKDYGATGDGATDDTTSIQNAIDAAESAGGGVVYFPPGNYEVTASLTVNSAGVMLQGTGRAVTRIFTDDTSVTVLQIGTLSIASKINYVGLSDIKIEAARSADASVYALEVYGTTFFSANRVSIEDGDSGIYFRNNDRFLLEDVDIECNDTSSVLLHLAQGQTDDVTIGVFTAVHASIRAASQIALKFDDAVGSSNANEFNRLKFEGCRLGGDNETGTTLIQCIAGIRNVHFDACQLRYGRDATFDATGADSTYRVRAKFTACAFLGISANPTTDHIAINDSDHMITVEDSQFDRGVDGIHFSGNNPRLILRNNEYSNLTNLINRSSGSPKVSVSGYQKIGSSSVTNVTAGSNIQVNASEDLIGDWPVNIQTATNYTMLISDKYIGVTSTAAERTITLLSSPGTGRVVTVKDESGGAGTNNITVDVASSGTIDGASTAVMTANFTSFTLRFNGSEWNIV